MTQELPQGSSTTQTLVVLDDDTIIIELFKRKCRRSNFQCKGFTDPDDALSFVSQHDVSLLFIDYNMPRTTGLEVLALIEQLPRAVARKYLCSSASLPGDISARAKSLGAETLLKDHLFDFELA